MKNKRILKCSLILIMLIVNSFIFNGNIVQASLQSNSYTQYNASTTLSNWVSLVRNMEKPQETMGFDEIVNSDLTSNASNGIDMHMMKSTEFGAVAILSASGYGNSKKLQDSTIKTTTGNKTGVYFSGTTNEHVAAFTGTQSYDTRYYDLYEGTPSWGRLATPKAGDAIGSSTATNPGCFGWHSAYNNNGYDDIRFPILRAGSGLFAIQADNYNGYSSDLSRCSRGVAVISDEI